MKKKAFIWGILLISIIYFPWSVYAAPSIATTSGTFLGGNNIVISGSSFGTGSTIYKWDDFEGDTHTVGNNVGVGPGSIAWNLTTAYNPSTISNKVPRTNSTQHIIATFSMATSYRGGIYMDYDGAIPSPVYISWWWRYDANGASFPANANWKPFWPVGLGGTPTRPRVSMHYTSEFANGLFAISPETGSSIQGYYGPVKQGDWVRWEFFGIESSGGVSDGTVVWEGQLSDGSAWTTFRHYEGNVKTRDSLHWNRSLFCDFAGRESDTNFDVFADDIYIANSRARVEIGDNSTWASSKHREIQVHTAWSNTSITVTVNQGLFSNCETLYLFVVDADGNVNTQGYPIRIVTGAGEPPCPPIGGKLFK